MSKKFRPIRMESDKIEDLMRKINQKKRELEADRYNMNMSKE